MFDAPNARPASDAHPVSDAHPTSEELAAHALELHRRGFNCAQCVACTLAPLVGADEDVCFRAAEGFGAGMGGMTETCGAVSGGVIALGMANSGGADAPTHKASTYRMVRELVERFRGQNGSTVCRELKGVGTGRPLRSCDDCIVDALLMADEILHEGR